MAGRSQQHVHDLAVAERRLRPIYEWLDAGNSKKALQEADKVLRKTPGLQCARALKALSLLQLGRESECVALLEQLGGETPVDNATLQAMTICYRDLQQLERVCGLYEAAVKASPNNEELHTHLFMSYVRTSDFKMQQQAALALYKLKPKNPYYFWAVMSVVLQAMRGRGARDPQQRSVLLALAQRMIDRLASEGRLEAEQELQLYLAVLELRGEDERALSVLDGPLGRKLMASGCAGRTRIPYLVRLGRWREVNSVCRELLRSSGDSWDVWQRYLTSVVELASEGEEERAHEFICELLLLDDDRSRARGPYLARLELCARLRDAGRTDSAAALLGDPLELLVEYFRQFGHKVCCASDLRPYLRLVEGATRRAELGARLLNDAGIGASTLPQSERQMRRHVAALQLSRLCGAHAGLDEDYLRALVAALALHYRHGAAAFAPPRPSTDQAPADAYGLLAAHALHDLSRVLSLYRSRPLVAAAALLERLLAASPSNFHARLLCVRLYHLIGAGEAAQRCFEPLDAKHLQLDSLGFVHCARLPSAGLLSLAAAHQDAAARFFAANYRDSIDHLTFSYKFGSFSKLNEFIEFRERLRDSLHRALVSVDLALGELAAGPAAAVRAASVPSDLPAPESARDNSDYGVYASWDAGTDDDYYLGLLLQHDRALLALRSTALRLLVALRDRTPDLRRFADRLDERLIACDSLPPRPRPRSLAQPLPSRLHSHLRPCSPVRLLAPLARLAVDPPEAEAEAKAKADADLRTKVRAGLRTAAESFAAAVEAMNRADDKLWERYADTERLAVDVEGFCLAALACAFCSPPSAPQQHKKKQRASNNATELTRGAADALELVDAALASWTPPDAHAPAPAPDSHPDHDHDRDSLCDGLRALSVADDRDERAVLEAVVSSHCTAQKEMRAAVASKLKYLNCHLSSAC